MAEPVAILLLSGTHERAHYAFLLAAGAAAMGRPVTIFASNAGCQALRPDWSSLDGSAHDATLRARGVAGLDTLREACQDLGVRLLVCDAGLRGAGLDLSDLLPGVEVAGIPSLLDAGRGGQIVTL